MSYRHPRYHNHEPLVDPGLLMVLVVLVPLTLLSLVQPINGALKDAQRAINPTLEQKVVRFLINHK